MSEERSRLWTLDEMELLAHAWGPSQLWSIPMRVYEGEARVEFDDEDLTVPITLFLPSDATDATKVHEAGHAVHLARYPESRTWSTEKCETFAFLGVVRLKLDDQYPDDAPGLAAARALFKREPVFYDRLMKLAAETDVGN